ncbi:HAD family hydrolase [Sphingomonas sp. GlSt437]|uniref:HAD family hydrolase n=1 Tax=Sphingomonas sp. GlSt437 TaxID=3389970 RepID=UPI003A8691D4
MQRLAIYDMDKTITRAPTWTPFLVAYARAKAPWRLALLPVAGLAALGYAVGWIGRGRLKEIAQGLLMGPRVDPADVAPVAAAFADRLIADGVYPEALARIAADRAEGYRVVLATASCRFYVDAIGARLGITDVVATDNQRDAKGRILARLAGENCYGAAKLAMIEAWLAREGIAREKATVRFYSDHVSDAPALAWADEAFAVNPHPPLRAMAQARGWTVLDWRQ